MDHTIRYLSRRDVEQVALPMEEIIAALESAFIEKDRGRTEAPPKPGIHPKHESFLHAMPARVAEAGAAGIKWVSGYPANPKRGLPYISGLLILNDPDTGLPISVMDCTWITAKRTAAASALAARHLARKNARVLGICGCGVQGRSHVEALSVVFPELNQVMAHDIDPEAMDRFLTDMRGAYPRLRFQPVSSAEAAVRDADVVVTAGPIMKDPKPTIQKGWQPAGGFASAVDFNSYWSLEALQGMDLLVTDDLEQFAYYRSLGFFSGMRDPDAELASLIVGKRPGRTRPDQRTMAMFLGLAIEDMVTALKILERARELGIGKPLDL